MTTKTSSVNTSLLRRAINSKINGGQWPSALFWCEQLQTLGVATAEDIVNYCRCLLFCGEYRRLLAYMEQNGLANCNRLFQLWTGRCLLEMRRYQEVVQLETTPCTPTASKLTNIPTDSFDEYAIEAEVESGFWLVLGMAYQELDERDLAKAAYFKCLEADPFCAEAFSRLSKNYLLTRKGDREALQKTCQIQEAATLCRQQGPLPSPSSSVRKGGGQRPPATIKEGGGGAVKPRGASMRSQGHRLHVARDSISESTRRRLLSSITRAGGRLPLMKDFNDESQALPPSATKSSIGDGFAQGAPPSLSTRSHDSQQSLAKVGISEGTKRRLLSSISRGGGQRAPASESSKAGKDIKETTPVPFSCPEGKERQAPTSGSWGVNELKRVVYGMQLGDREVYQSRLSAFLKNDIPSRLALAERLYSRGQYRAALSVTSDVLKRDDSYLDCLPLHLALLTSLEKTNELFTLAHRLQETFPNETIFWYAVACYYYCTKRYDAAKKFFYKCTSVDSRYCLAWIGYGHSFAAEQEHDQAMMCYCRAWKIVGGCHLPLLYAGLEYSLTNNLRLAEQFLWQALSLAPDDPYVLHEMGALMFKLAAYDCAREFLNKALEVVTADTPLSSMSPIWEPLLNNLGHVYRKLKLYDQALRFHRDALQLVPDDPSSLTSIGFLLMLQRQPWDAVEHLNHALAIDRNDVVTAGLLTKAMDMLSDFSGLSSTASSSQQQEEQFPAVPRLRKFTLDVKDTPLAASTCSVSDVTMDISDGAEDDLGEADMEI